jgi:lipid A 3-O-deacylase
LEGVIVVNSALLNCSKIFALCFILFFAVQSNIYTQENGSAAISVAKFDVLGSDHDSDEARLEYRHSVNDWRVYPFAGLMANSSGAFYFYSGFIYDLFITDYLVITPSFAPGLWHRGQSKDLNFLIEFRSQIELAFILENESRIGISFNHVSNGSFGESNPGVESLAITYVSQVKNILAIF